MKAVLLEVVYAAFVTLVICQTDSDPSASSSACSSVLEGYVQGKMASVLESLQVDSLKKEFQRVLDTQATDIGQLKRDILDMKSDRIFNRSAVYTRWGKTTCPNHAETVYSGYVGGSHSLHPGAAAEPVCLPQDPEWGIYTEGHDGHKAYMFGAEYESNSLTDSRKNLHDYNVPCAVCRVYQRSISRMIPGRRTCYPGWNMEYTGYLMAGHRAHAAASQYNCIDESPDVLPGTQQNQDGRLFFPVEVACGSLPCVTYANGRELACVVCSV